MSAEKDVKKIEKLLEKKKSEKIIDYLNSKDAEVAAAAFQALGQIGGEAATNALAAKLDDPSPVVRSNAVKAFGNLHTEYAKSLLQHQIAKESDEGVKEDIRTTLLTYGRK